MTSTNPKGRIKRRHCKTRTGCSTCKRRHFKCDERKPDCLRCMLDGKKCEYNVPQTKLFPALQSHHSNHTSPGPCPAYEICDPAEQRALLYFRERTGPGLTGFTSYTNTFWNSLIPGLSESEPAIRHIVIAIATKHEALNSNPERAVELEPLCAKHHSLALRTLTRPSLFQNEEILLVSCIAFITFERLQDPYGTAGHYLRYVVAGLKILKERERLQPPPDNAAPFNLVDSFIEPMFFQIQLVLSMFCEPARLICNNTEHVNSVFPDIPPSFSSLEKARDAFFRICVWRFILSHRGEIWGKTSESFLQIKSLFAKWHESLNALEAKFAADDMEDRRRSADPRRHAQIFVGAILFSVEEDVPTNCLTRPTLVYLSMPSKIAIFTRISNSRKINLSGINNGLWPWPHAKRVGGPGGENFVVLELSSTSAASARDDEG